MTIHEKLQKFAFEVAYPYIAKQPIIRDCFEKLCFLLVGSVATGLCTERSDVDICILCHQEVFDKISENTGWLEGRPTETIINGIQLHYYAVSVESIADKINRLDDTALYVYGNAININDNISVFSKIRDLINSAEITETRMNKALDSLQRRKRVLHQVLREEQDPFLRLSILTELLELLLTCIALKDKLQFDKRKRFYTTALAGNNGRRLKHDIDKLFSLLGEISRIESVDKTDEFLKIFDDCCSWVL